jgi:hypothetical protein
MTPLRSFSYRSQTVYGNGTDQLMPFDDNGHWQMAYGFAAPGAGKFPQGSFWVRKVAITHWLQRPTQNSYAVVGHSGENGDWVSPMIVGCGQAVTSYDGAAPLFTPGEYFDVHACCHKGKHWVAVCFWWIPQ